jgi:hypothetical protein
MLQNVYLQEKRSMSFEKKLSGRLTGRRIPEALTGEDSPFPGASQGGVVSVNTVQGIVQQSLKGKFAPDPGIRYGDGTFYLPTLQEVQFILQQSQLDRMI